MRRFLSLMMFKPLKENTHVTFWVRFRQFKWWMEI